MPPPLTDREALIAALAEQARNAAGEIPDPEPEELLDFLAGRLAPEDEGRVDRQLAASPDAAAALLDLADLEAAGATAGTQPAELAVHAGWRDLRGRLPAAVPWFRRLPPMLSSVAAAVLLVTTVGLVVRDSRLSEEINRPVANGKTLELPSGSRAGGEPVLALRPGEPFRLVLDPTERCPVYTAKIEGPGNGDPQIVERLKPDAKGRLSMFLRDQPGTYKLSLAGCEPRRELEKHQFRITADGG